MAYEEAVPGEFGVERDIESMLWVSAGEEVLCVNGQAAHISTHVFFEIGKLLCGHGLVGGPANAVLGALCFHNILVFWGAAGEFARGHHEASALSKMAFFVLKGVFDELSLIEVGVFCRGGFEHEGGLFLRVFFNQMCPIFVFQKRSKDVCANDMIILLRASILNWKI